MDSDATEVLEPNTTDKSSTWFIFLNAKWFSLALLKLTLLQIAQATFNSLNHLVQRANSHKEHTSHCCGVQKKKTVYSFCFRPLYQSSRGPNQGVLIGSLKWTIWSRWGWKVAKYWRWMALREGKNTWHLLVTNQPAQRCQHSGTEPKMVIYLM